MINVPSDGSTERHRHHRNSFIRKVQTCDVVMAVVNVMKVGDVNDES